MLPPDGKSYCKSGGQADFHSHGGNVPEVHFKSIIWYSEYIREAMLGCSGEASVSHTVSQVSPSGPTEKSPEEPQAKKKKKNSAGG